MHQFNLWTLSLPHIHHCIFQMLPRPSERKCIFRANFLSKNHKHKFQTSHLPPEYDALLTIFNAQAIQKEGIKFYLMMKQIEHLHNHQKNTFVSQLWDHNGLRRILKTVLLEREHGRRRTRRNYWHFIRTFTIRLLLIRVIDVYLMLGMNSRDFRQQREIQ